MYEYEIMPYKFNNSHFTYTNMELKTKTVCKAQIGSSIERKKHNKIHIGYGFFRGLNFG
jgi:hypothetical protein